MDYYHDSFSFNPEAQVQAMYYPPVPHPVFMAYPGQPLIDDYYSFPHPHDYDYLPAGTLPEDYDDMGEVTSRPRLTKEQVEVLEAQFQAHPKPNSVVKRQLAMQTKLSLPRVAVCVFWVSVVISRNTN